MKENIKSYCIIFIIFAKIGLMAFGGGYAILPILQRELIEKRNWIGDKELTNYFAVSQCLPGVIAGNVAIFIGKKKRGTVGAVCAILGVIFPSLVIITVIAALFLEYSHLQQVEDAFVAVRATVCVLILGAIIKLWKNSVVDKITFVIFIVVTLSSVIINITPIVYVIVAAVIGMIAYKDVEEQLKDDKENGSCRNGGVR